MLRDSSDSTYINNAEQQFQWQVHEIKENNRFTPKRSKTCKVITSIYLCYSQNTHNTRFLFHKYINLEIHVSLIASSATFLLLKIARETNCKLPKPERS